MPSYTLEKKLMVKELVVMKHFAPDAVSKIFNGRPSANTITNWADHVDEETGKTWWDERREFAKKAFEELSPKRITTKILQRISDLLDDPKFSSDALAKEMRALERLTSPDNQIHVMYQMLTDFMLFIKEKNPALLSKELNDMFRDFRTHLRARLDT